MIRKNLYFGELGMLCSVCRVPMVRVCSGHKSEPCLGAAQELKGSASSCSGSGGATTALASCSFPAREILQRYASPFIAPFL